MSGAPPEIRIDKDVPLPPRSAIGRPPIYPWRRLEVGDSFLVDSSKVSVRNQANLMGAKTGKKFSVRKTEDGFRVWRTA